MTELNIHYDLGTRSLYDTNPIELDGSKDVVMEKAKKNFMKLLKKIEVIRDQSKVEREERKLENQFIDFEQEENVVELPDSQLDFPRFKPLPAKPILTKWEQFAKNKGIKKKKKRSALVYSEEKKDWVQRWGRHSHKKIKEGLDVIRVAKR